MTAEDSGRRRYRLLRFMNRTIARFDRRAAHVPEERDDFGTRVYMDHIERDVAAALRDDTNITVVDAGCGTGRLAVPLAQKGYSVTGIDYHQPSLDRARERAEEVGVELDLVAGDLLSALRELPKESTSIVLCAGAIYTCMDYREILREFRRILKPGGLLIVDFLSRFFMLTTLLKRRKFSTAKRVVTEHEGTIRLALSPAYYWWTTADDARMLISELELDVVSIEPIARFYGDGSDGMASIVDIDELSDRDELDALYEIERSALPRYPDIAKFIYVAAQKRQRA